MTPATQEQRPPGPWRERIATGDAARVISDGNGRPVCEIPYRFGTPEQRAADSRLIRHACNAHDELVAALRDLRKMALPHFAIERIDAALKASA